MDRADKFINNSAPKKMILALLVLVSLFSAADFLIAGKIADQVSRHKLEAFLSGAGGGSITRQAEDSAIAAGENALSIYNIDRDLPPRIVYGWYDCRNKVFLVLFIITTTLSVIWAVIAVHSLFHEYDGMEKLNCECRRAAEKPEYSVALQGDSADCLRRLSESADLLVRRIERLNGELMGERLYLREFLQDFSHQIKTSLAVVRLNLDILSETEELSPERREALADEIQLNLDGMEELVVQAIKTARLDTDSIEYHMESAELSDTCRKALRRIEPLLRSRNITLKTYLPKGIIFSHDRGWLCEAIENIVKNSADHSECTEIYAVAEIDPIMIKLILSDNGKGIPQEKIPHLFDRFAHRSSDRSMKSAGLGMSIAQKITKRHGGEIYVYSKVGEGTRFEMVFLK